MAHQSAQLLSFTKQELPHEHKKRVKLTTHSQNY